MTQKVGGVEFNVDVDASGAVKAATIVTSSNDDIEKSYERVEQATKKLPTALSRLSAQYTSSNSKLKEFIAKQVEAGRSIDENGNVITAYGVKARGLTAELESLTSAFQNKKEKSDAVGQAIESLISKTKESKEAEVSHKTAVDSLNTSLSEAAGKYSAMGQSAADMHDDLQRSNATLANAIARQISLGNSVDKNNKVIDKNGNELADATAALQKYARAQELAREKVDKSSEAFSRMTKRSKTAFNNIGQNAGMAGIQIQQFVGQIQGGQSALLALSQQGADLGFVLGRAGLGAAVGIAATAISFLIPALTGADSKVSELKDRIKDLGDEIELTSNQVTFLARDSAKEIEALSKSSDDAAKRLAKAKEEMELLFPWHYLLLGK
jgi:chromosome segregation ATPase